MQSVTTAATGADARIGLGCVAVPMTARDLATSFGPMLDLWRDQRFFPVKTPQDQPRPVLLLVLNKASGTLLDQARQMVADRPDVAGCFSQVAVQDAGLEGARDLYLRPGEVGPAPFGTRAGPNFLFHETMRAAARFGGYTLQIETDCLPVSAGWVDAARQVLADHPGAWVIGSMFAGTGDLDRSIATHLNGNALYKTGDPAFQAFVRDVWIPRMLRLTPVMPNLAYDCWWALERWRADPLSDSSGWTMVQTYDFLFRNAPLVVNLLEDGAGIAGYAPAYDRHARLGRPPVFLHGAPLRGVTAALLAHPRDDIFAAINRVAPGAVPRHWPWRPVGQGGGATDLATGHGRA
jgi:hypothetical protein